MKPSELFGVIMRVIGLVMTVYGIWQLPFAMINTVLESQQHIRVPGAFATNLATLLCAVLTLLAGLWFIRGAKSLIALAYPNEASKESTDDNGQGSFWW